MEREVCTQSYCYGEIPLWVAVGECGFLGCPHQSPDGDSFSLKEEAKDIISHICESPVGWATCTEYSCSLVNLVYRKPHLRADLGSGGLHGIPCPLEQQKGKQQVNHSTS